MKLGGRGLTAEVFTRGGTDSAAAVRADLADDFEIRELLAHVQRTYSNFGFIALYSVDDSNRTERAQPNTIPDPERTPFTGSAGVPPAFFFRLDFASLNGIIDDFPIPNHPHTAKLRGQAPFLILSSCSLNSSTSLTCGLRGALSFALQFGGSSFGFTLDFRARSAIFNLRQQFTTTLFKVSDGLTKFMVEFGLARAFPLFGLLIQLSELLRHGSALFFQRLPQTLSFFSFALDAAQIFHSVARRLLDMLRRVFDYVVGNAEATRDF